jgi:hypothetical protein
MSTLKLTSGGDYVYWLIPGILAQSAVFGSAPTAYGLNNDITKSVLDRSLPMARSAVLAGRTLPDLVRSTFILSLQLAVGILLGFRCHNGITGLLAAMAVALAFGYACSWLMAYITHRPHHRRRNPCSPSPGPPESSPCSSRWRYAPMDETDSNILALALRLPALGLPVGQLSRSVGLVKRRS